MVVEFLKDYNGFQKKGEILDVNTPLAEFLISEKIVKKVKNGQSNKNTESTDITELQA